MTKLEIVLNEDTNQRAFLSEETMNVIEILKDFYPYLYYSIKKEGLIIKYEECNLFKELVFENNVAGFCSFDFSRNFITAAFNNVYVLPEYRGNKLFIEELKNTMMEHNKPSIMEPTRLIIELLIRYGFAVKVNENIVASAIELIVPSNHLLSNSDYLEEDLSTHFYDLSISSCIHILDIKKSHIAYSSPLNYDIIHYDNVGNVTDDYIDNLIDFFKNNELELMNTLLELEEGLPVKKYTLEEVIGKDGEFSEFIESMIEDAHVTRSKAFKIKQQIKEEYEAGMILKESLLIRLAYLFNDKYISNETSHKELCSYCNMPIDSHDKFCHFCGINLSYNPEDVEESLSELLNESGSDISEDMRFIAYKFLRLIEDGFDVEYSIFTIEEMYECYWNDLRYFLTFNNYFKDDKITDEGYDFLNTHPLHFWEKYQMTIVDYSDFEKYFYNNNDLDSLEICLNYLKQFGEDKDILEIISEIKKDLN